MGDPIVDLSFHGGIDQASRDEYIAPGAGFPVLENVRQDKRGGLSKRRGYTSVSPVLFDGSARTAGYRLIVKGDQVGVIDGERLWVRSTTLGADVDRGRVPEATYRFLDIPSVGVAGRVDDLVECNGFVVVSWRVLNDYGAGVDSDHYVSIIDPVDGTIIRSAEVVDSGVLSYTSLAAVGTTVFAITADLDEDEIRAVSIDVSSTAGIYFGWSLPTVLASDFGSGHSVSVLSNAVVVAYGNDGLVDATSRVTVMAFDSNGVIDAIRLNTSSAIPNDDGIGTSEGGSMLWVAWNESTIVRVAGVTLLGSSLVVDSAAGDIIDVSPTSASAIERVSVCPREDGTTGKGVLLLELSFSGMRMRAFREQGGATVTDGFTGTNHGIGLAGRPFLRAGELYTPFYFIDTLTTSNIYVLCSFNPDEVTLANIVPNLRPVAAPVVRGLFDDGAFGMRCRTISVDDTKYLFGFTIRKSGVSVGTKLVEYDFSASHRWRSISMGDVVHISGGVHSMYDGNRVFEVGFLTSPTQPSLDVGSAGSLTFTNGGRKYVAVYEHVDATGARHISGVSVPSIACGNIASKKVAITTAPLSMTSRTEVRVVFYATLDGGEPPYYRVPGPGDAPSATIVVNGYVQFEDNASESDLAEQELLYGTGFLPGTGAGQDHRAPPGLTCITAYNGMLVGSSGRTLWYTAATVDGEGAYFSPVFTAEVPHEVTALASQDGVLYAFFDRGIYSISGDAPSDNGLVGGLGSAQRLAADVGCINQNSVVVTSLGTFFESRRGIELLSRGGAVTWVGEKVASTTRGSVITSAVFDDRNGLVIFSLAGSLDAGLVSATGSDLVFDLTTGMWQSVDIKRGATASQASQDASMVTIDGEYRYGWLGVNGTLYVERASNDNVQYLDGTSWVRMRIETPWIHIAGLQGEQVVEKYLFLAQEHDTHDLTVSVYRDYLSSSPEVTTFTNEQIAALPKEWLEGGLETSRGQAVKFVIEDASPTSGSSSGRGATWLNLTLVGVPHRGPKRTSAAERGG